MKPRLVLTAFACLLSVMPAAVAPSFGATPSLPSLGDTERDDLSPLQERKVGDQIMQELRRDRDYLDDAPLLEYLNNFGNILLTAAPDARGEANYDFFFFAVRDPMLNAFALPGGNIAVHSGLMLAAQSESELASVMAHEIGHVSQRHIARSLGKQKKDALIPLAAFALAVLAARANSDAAGALMMGGQGLAIQRQLSFSRDAEREADRVGLNILHAANFDTSGMVAFFGRLQTASRAYTDNMPAFLMSHPLTTERISDIQNRIQDFHYKQRIDSLDFFLIRSRVRILQDESTAGLRDAASFFEIQLQQRTTVQVAAANYGLAMIALREGDYARARSRLKDARLAAEGTPSSTKEKSAGGLFDSLTIDIEMGAGRYADAIKAADIARTAYPLSRGIARQYAEALIAAGQYPEAVAYLRDQAQLYRQEPQIQDLLARVYAAQGKQALQHLALAESYSLTGNLLAALEQFTIARKAPDASFYDHSVTDAREREVQQKWKDEMKDKEKGRF
jgi:predicted Zn-dependent protease